MTELQELKQTHSDLYRKYGKLVEESEELKSEIEKSELWIKLQTKSKEIAEINNLIIDTTKEIEKMENVS